MKILLIAFCLEAFVFRCSGLRTNELKYHRQSRPKNDSSATDVNVSLFIRSIEIDDVRQVVGITCEMNQMWHDDRNSYLAGPHDDVILHRNMGPEILKIWLPDITAVEALPASKKHDLDFIRIRPADEHTWTQTFYIEFPCEMDFESYPLDKHECQLKLQSVSYYEDELNAIWAKGIDVEKNDDELHITPRYELIKIVTSSVTVASRPRVKRQLIAEFHFESISGWTTKHTVMPFVAAVTTAYLTFFIDPKGVCARILVCGIAMIMASIFHESTYRNSPKPEYTMGLEVFTGTCLTFIWFAAVETVVVHVLSNLGKDSFSSNCPSLVESEERSTNICGWVDRIFKFLYPAAFIAFNAVYWIVYS